MIEVSFGTLVTSNRIDWMKSGGYVVHPATYEDYSPMSIQYVDGRISYSIQFWNPTDRSAVELKDGDFKVRSAHLDRNYSSRAFEVVTEDGSPVLQVIWLTSNHMRLSGLFPLPNGELLCMSNDTAQEIDLQEIGTCKITPIFKYPSWKYQGELN
ncbi:MAG: hypothetical protein WA354_13295 [Terracidiphilus sp.]